MFNQFTDASIRSVCPGALVFDRDLTRQELSAAISYIHNHRRKIDKHYQKSGIRLFKPNLALVLRGTVPDVRAVLQKANPEALYVLPENIAVAISGPAYSRFLTLFGSNGSIRTSFDQHEIAEFLSDDAVFLSCIEQIIESSPIEHCQPELN